jgi:two-component system, NtrC family, response regulator AtoC
VEKTKKQKKILFLKRASEDRSHIETMLRCEGYKVEAADDAGDAIRLLEQSPFDFSALLLSLPGDGSEGLGLLRRIRRHPECQELPLIVLSGPCSTATIVEAIKAGADDFLIEPVSPIELASALDRPLTRGDALKPFSGVPNQTGRTPAVSFCPGGWLGAMRASLERIGASGEPVVIQGETGVGKEVVAQLLHACSARAGRPFLKLNCAALPSELVESELFGFEKGAFTGALNFKPGKFERADTGTLLLDEIGDMDFRIQAKLLQVLQDHQFERLGGKETISVDVRVIAATHCDLEKAIEEGRFRADLYHRLNVINLRVPPLRERLEEIIPLAELFLSKHTVSPDGKAEITPALREALNAYHWPGNVRELENFMRRYEVLRSVDQAVEELHRRSQRSEGREAADSGGPFAVPSPGAVLSLSKVDEAQRNLEAEVILNALNATQWNRKMAAARLHIDYKALLYKMKKLGLDTREASVRRNAQAGSRGLGTSALAGD